MATVRCGAKPQMYSFAHAKAHSLAWRLAPPAGRGGSTILPLPGQAHRRANAPKSPRIPRRVRAVVQHAPEQCSAHAHKPSPGRSEKGGGTCIVRAKLRWARTAWRAIGIDRTPAAVCSGGHEPPTGDIATRAHKPRQLEAPVLTFLPSVIVAHQLSSRVLPAISRHAFCHAYTPIKGMVKGNGQQALPSGPQSL
jgi:hypothetical protein